jgi:hypothetical protein
VCLNINCVVLLTWKQSQFPQLGNQLGTYVFSLIYYPSWGESVDIKWVGQVWGLQPVLIHTEVLEFWPLGQPFYSYQGGFIANISRLSLDLCKNGSNLMWKLKCITVLILINLQYEQHTGYTSSSVWTTHRLYKFLTWSFFVLNECTFVRSMSIKDSGISQKFTRHWIKDLILSSTIK